MGNAKLVSLTSRRWAQQSGGAVPRSKADDIAAALLPYVRAFTGSTGGGQWSFQLLCSVSACRREDHVSTSSHGIQSERAREKASLSLALKGWAFQEKPVCPQCAKKSDSAQSSGRTNANRTLHCRELEAGDDLAALTALLHAAYAPHAAKGLRYWASHQSVEDTAARLAQGHGLVGTVEGQIIATLTLRRPNPKSRVELFRDPDTWSFSQFAVHPDHKGKGYGKQLHDFAVAFAVARGCRRMALDTAQPAQALITMYASWGYTEVGSCDWRPRTNYLSIVMQKAVADAASHARQPFPAREK
jgi:GNAT superfamily N-acetyltransferase